MTEKEQLINDMKDILIEVHSIDDEITYNNFYSKYCDAANQLDFEENEDGENDIYEFIYRHGNDFFGLKHKLIAILKAEGLTEDQRKVFYNKVFTL